MLTSSMSGTRLLADHFPEFKKQMANAWETLCEDHVLDAKGENGGGDLPHRKGGSFRLTLLCSWVRSLAPDKETASCTEDFLSAYSEAR